MPWKSDIVHRRLPDSKEPGRRRFKASGPRGLDLRDWGPPLRRAIVCFSPTMFEAFIASGWSTAIVRVLTSRNTRNAQYHSKRDLLIFMSVSKHLSEFRLNYTQKCNIHPRPSANPLYSATGTMSCQKVLGFSGFSPRPTNTNMVRESPIAAAADIAGTPNIGITYHRHMSRSTTPRMSIIRSR